MKTTRKELRWKNGYGKNREFISRLNRIDEQDILTTKEEELSFQYISYLRSWQVAISHTLPEDCGLRLPDDFLFTTTFGFLNGLYQEVGELGSATFEQYLVGALEDFVAEEPSRSIEFILIVPRSRWQAGKK